MVQSAAAIYICDRFLNGVSEHFRSGFYKLEWKVFTLVEMQLLARNMRLIPPICNSDML
jgi:hypothetical protein